MPLDPSMKRSLVISTFPASPSFTHRSLPPLLLTAYLTGLDYLLDGFCPLLNTSAAVNRQINLSWFVSLETKRAKSVTRKCLWVQAAKGDDFKGNQLIPAPRFSNILLVFPKLFRAGDVQAGGPVEFLDFRWGARRMKNATSTYLGGGGAIRMQRQPAAPDSSERACLTAGLTPAFLDIPTWIYSLLGLSDTKFSSATSLIIKGPQINSLLVQTNQYSSSLFK